MWRCSSIPSSELRPSTVPSGLCSPACSVCASPAKTCLTSSGLPTITTFLKRTLSGVNQRETYGIGIVNMSPYMRCTSRSAAMSRPAPTTAPATANCR